jgi:hypothetical protein
MEVKLPHLFSYSQLGTYKDCGEKYRLHYMAGDKRPDHSVYTEIGSLIHECIERYYMGEFISVEAAFPTVITEYLEKLGIPEYQPELEAISKVLSNLMNRASSSYTGKDAIRNADGSVSKAPDRTRAWKEDLKKHDVESRMDTVNWHISRRVPDGYRSIKMTTVYAEVEFLAKAYVHPSALKEVKAIEFGFSEPDYKGDPNSEDPNQREPHIKNLVTLPSGNVFRGYIDLVGKLHNGGWVIADHKSSQECPSTLKVKHHEQLLLYSFFWHQLTGSWPEKIAINHLRSGTFVMADLDPTLATEAATRHDEVVRSINKKIFIKNAPFEYGSPCIGRDGALESSCQYLPVCHKDVAVSMGWVDPAMISLPLADELDVSLPALSNEQY